MAVVDSWLYAFIGETRDECVVGGLKALEALGDQGPPPGYCSGSKVLGKMTESLQLIWPGQPPSETENRGDVLLEEDAIVWTCEEGPIAAAPYVARMMPAPRAAPYYCGFIQVNQSPTLDHLRAAGYGNLELQETAVIHRKWGIANILAGMLACRKAGDDRDWLELARTWVATLHGVETLLLQRKNLLVMEILKAYLHLPDLSLETMTRSQKVMDTVGEGFRLVRVRQVRNLRGLYVVPSWLYEANRALAAKGWPPVTPQWLGPRKFQYNGGYDSGCSGRFRGFECTPPLKIEEIRILHHNVMTYTFHIAHNAINRTSIHPSTEWEEQAESLIRELAVGEPGTSFTPAQRSAFGLAMLREVPTVIQREDQSLDYFRSRITEDRVQRDLPDSIEVFRTNAVGEMLTQVAGTKGREKENGQPE